LTISLRPASSLILYSNVDAAPSIISFAVCNNQFRNVWLIR
jgi:hypothetical protein